MRRLLVAIALAVLLGSGVAVAATYTVSVDDAMEVPDRSVSVAGETYEVSSLARVDRGDPLTAQTTGGDDDGYRVYVHDAGGDVVDQQYVFPEDDGAVAFDTSPYEPGSYVLSTYHDGTYYDPHPVVVPAYDVSAAVPSGVGDDETVEIAVTLTERESGHPVRNVTVVVSNETVTRRYVAEEDGDAYVLDVDGGDLSSGNYSVYAAVTGTDDFSGPTNELIGVSDSSTLTVEAGSDGADDADSSEGSASESSDESDGSDGSDESDETDPGSAPTEAGTEPTNQREDGDPSETASADPETDSVESDDAVISPEPVSDEPQSAGAVEERAGGVSVALLALLAVVGALTVWRSGRSK